MAIRRFALIYGIVFLVVGILGFVPGMTAPHEHPDVRVTSGLALELGMFPINVLHNLVHIVFGLWGLAVARNAGGARLYARVVAVVYALLMVMGLIPAMNLHTGFGLVPLYGYDIGLHAVLAVIAAYFGFMHKTRESA